jgi:hypothetical protein
MKRLLAISHALGLAVFLLVAAAFTGAEIKLFPR